MRALAAWRAAVTASMLLFAGCGDDDAPLSSLSPTAPTGGAVTPVSATVQAAMTEAILDEYENRLTYEGVLADFGGGTLPFSMIVTAEAQHAASLVQLFTNRGLAVPPPVATPATVPRFASVPAACGAAAESERGNVAMYDRLLLAADLPNDVRNVFANNRAASLFGHLTAFEQCR
jgi:hypothetical protein